MTLAELLQSVFGGASGGKMTLQQLLAALGQQGQGPAGTPAVPVNPGGTYNPALGEQPLAGQTVGPQGDPFTYGQSGGETIFNAQTLHGQSPISSLLGLGGGTMPDTTSMTNDGKAPKNSRKTTTPPVSLPQNNTFGGGYAPAPTAPPIPTTPPGTTTDPRGFPSSGDDTQPRVKLFQLSQAERLAKGRNA